MRDSKISALTGLATPDTLDELVIVDKSDTTDGADGSSRKVTVGNLLAQADDLNSDLVTLTGSQVLTNKTLTSSVLNTGVSGTAVLDEDTMSSDSATKLATQQSIKAYVDTHAADTTTHGAAGAIVGISDTQTLTNKRITRRVTTITSHATPTVNTDNCDAVTITAQGEAITSMTTNLSGTPTNFQTLIFRIKDDGTGRAITWGASFEAKGVTLPTTTTASKVLTVGFIYDTVTSKWGCVASQQEA